MKVGFKTPSDRQEARLNPHKKLTVIFKKSEMFGIYFIREKKQPRHLVEVGSNTREV